MARDQKVGQLWIEFKSSMNSWNAEMKSMAKETKAFERALKPTVDMARSVGAGMLAAGAAITGSLTAMVMSAANYGDAIRDASIRTGIATDQLGILKYTAEQNGLSFEGMQVGLKKFAVSIHEAATGSKEQAALFRSMGAAVKDAKGHYLPLTDVLGKVSDKFNAMPDGVEKTALAVKLFGRNGVEMIEFMSLGSKGMKEFEARAQRLGLAIGPGFANQADAFKDALADMKAAFLGLSVSAGKELLPAITRFVTQVSNGVSAVREFADAHQYLWKATAGLAAALMGPGGVILAGSIFLTQLPKIKAGIDAITLAMARNPVGALAVGITAAIVAIVQFRTEIKAFLVDVGVPFLQFLIDMDKRAEITADFFGLKRMAKYFADDAGEVQETFKWLKGIQKEMDYDAWKQVHDEMNAGKISVGSLGKSYEDLAGSIKDAQAANRKWKQELPETLPWFMRANPEAAMSGGGGIGRRTGARSMESMPMPMAPGAVAGGGGSSTISNSVFAPVFHFDGVPADAETFFRQKLDPILRAAYEGSGTHQRALANGLRQQGVAFRNG